MAGEKDAQSIYMYKFYFSAVIYSIAFFIIGVGLRKQLTNGDFIIYFFRSLLKKIFKSATP